MLTLIYYLLTIISVSSFIKLLTNLSNWSAWSPPNLKEKVNLCSWGGSVLVWNWDWCQHLHCILFGAETSSVSHLNFWPARDLRFKMPCAQAMQPWHMNWCAGSTLRVAADLTLACNSRSSCSRMGILFTFKSNQILLYEEAPSALYNCEWEELPRSMFIAMVARNQKRTP